MDDLLGLGVIQRTPLFQSGIQQSGVCFCTAGFIGKGPEYERTKLFHPAQDLRQGVRQQGFDLLAQPDGCWRF